MSERTIKGEIEKWGEMKTGTGQKGIWYKTSYKINGSWHSRFMEGAEVIYKMMNKIPVGSVVEFKEWKNDGSEYWNYKDKTFKLISTQEMKSIQDIPNPKVNPHNETLPITSRELREIRGKCIMYSKDIKGIDTPQDILATAKIFEAYVLDKPLKDDSSESPSSNPDEIPEEEIDMVNNALEE